MDFSCPWKGEVLVQDKIRRKEVRHLDQRPKNNLKKLSLKIQFLSLQL